MLYKAFPIQNRKPKIQNWCHFRKSPEIIPKKTLILNIFGQGGKPFQLIEFGAGDGLKTKVLLKHFLKRNARFKYYPIDISNNVLEELSEDLSQNFPSLVVEPLNNEYFKALDKLDHSSEDRKAILFLGSNIGNFTEDQAVSFLSQLAEKLSPQDYLMVGFDLKKDPETILNAYHDPHGITKAFNLNLLERINDELGGNFDTTNFKHWPIYNPLTGATKSFLISMKSQEVFIESLKQNFSFEAWEAIDMEISQKYDLEAIKNLGARAGFEVAKQFFDCKHYFVNTIFRLI
ncbi:MAG: L-histidine N(alpha)-methyltransferase [Leptolyngbya sp. SIO1D8]|nr:L-histidine N(alpha)-methyltransferase [Leptolyngbya sp. SIO1D8]